MPQDFLSETKVTVGIHRREFTRKIQIVIKVSFCQNLFSTFFIKYQLKPFFNFQKRDTQLTCLTL